MTKLLLARCALSIALLLALTACSATKAIFETEPEAPSPEDTVRILCARNANGEPIFGIILLSHGDTTETKEQVIRHNRAWREATDNGALCK